MSTELKLQWRELAAGMGFTEGPIAYQGDIVFTSINRGKLYRVGLRDSEASEFVETGGGPNGLAMGSGGEIFVAQNGGQIIPTKSGIRRAPSIQAVSAGRTTRLISDNNYYAPNDCAFGPDGRLWFTDPYGSTIATERKPGRVWALNVATGEVELIADDLSHPNGLAFGPDTRELYVAETLRQRVIRLTRSAVGWRNNGVFATLPVGEPDGMAFDTVGRLWVAASKGDAIAVFAPNGSLAHVIDLGPSHPTNLCFGGPDRETLVVTVPKGGRLLATEVSDPGLALLSPR